MKKCPECGYEIIKPARAKMSPVDWAYTKTSDEEKNDALKKAEIRQRVELGYGIPDTKQNDDPENLGSCITGKWRNNDKRIFQKENKVNNQKN